MQCLFANNRKMYKGLLEQPTFVYTECSDVTEVFVTSQAAKILSSKEMTSSKRQYKTRFRMQGEEGELSANNEVDEVTKPQVKLSVISAQYDRDDCVHGRLDTIHETDPAMTSQRKTSEVEFLEFARDFARQVGGRNSESLLNPSQYDAYLQKVASRDRLHGNDYFHSGVDLSRVPVRSSSLEETGHDVDGHVVGDLVSFAANTMRYIRSLHDRVLREFT